MAARKIMILGAIGVGKTSLANRLAFGRFETSYKATIGVDIYTTTAPLPGGAKAMPLVLWDTDGDFGLSIFRTVYLKGASGALIVADVTRPASLDQMAALIAGFREALPGRPCAAVLNKSDLVAGDSGEPGSGAPPDLLARARGADVVALASARTGHGVAGLFAELATTIQRRSL
ncbi:Rab family GTPase [Methylobacterium aquaticum]|uniref:Rab family GTPase n=1 Tax=Methylobacterium aquaticum TaxID=270351 RepID=UPI003D182D79